jgi:hypothetical protein
MPALDGRPEPFAAGSVVTVREVLHGQVWLEFSETVVADDGEVLATLQRDGTPMTFHQHPWGPHPWSGVHAWRGPTVLKLRRPGEWYSVWKFFAGAGAGFRFWYVNFERPVVRTGDGIEVNDLQLDLVIEPDGTWRWKDVEDLGPALASGRIDLYELRGVLDAAPDVVDRIEGDDRWWSAWDGWTPS